MFLTRRFVSRLPWLCGESSSEFLRAPLIPDFDFELHAAALRDGSLFTVFDVLSETVGIEMHSAGTSRIMWLRFDPSQLVGCGSADCHSLVDGILCGRLVAKKKEE